MISVSTALSHINDAATRLKLRPAIGCAIDQALDYVLAEDIHAALTHPPADMSAMDGYAVKLSDVGVVGKTLSVIGESRAGEPFAGTLKTGQAVRIFTGAIIPNGADTVLIQENAARDGDIVTVTTAMDKVRHIRRGGNDFTRGDVVIPSGTLIEPRHIAVAAAANIASFKVKPKLRVAILSNGDELKPVGSELSQGQIINSNGPALSSLLSTWGVEVIDLGIGADNLDDLRARIETARDADIILPIGGASVGDHDVTKDAFWASGFKEIFAKVAVKPGKPIWMAQKNDQYVLGLPGNPASALVCAQLFLRPLLGLENKVQSARLSEPISANGSRENYLRGVAEIKEGRLMAKAFPKQDSGLIRPFSQANCLIQLPPNNGPWSEGEAINILPIAPIL